MTVEEFDKFIKEEILPDCQAIMSSKGISYSGLEDKLGNFKRLSVLTNTESEKVLFIYFTKHFDALSSYIRGEYKDSESIRGRILDIINYMLLLAALLKEQNKI
jgi:hypothetical protein